MRRPYNLASRPFRNQTLPALLLAFGWMALLAGTGAHVLAVRALGPERTGALHREVEQLEARRARLEARARRLHRDVPAATLKEWSFVRELVDRRAFSWTRLLSQLEQALPPGVRVTAVSPEVRGERLELALGARVRAQSDGLELVRRLEERAEFEQVDPLSASDYPDGRQMRLHMLYAPPERLPGRLPAARPAGSAGRRRVPR